MPGLIDLPPELIERIYKQYGSLLIKEVEIEDDLKAIVASQLGHFRLTNRYVERATRRCFIPFGFNVWHIHAPTDANIQKFCAMAKTPDLAASVHVLRLDADDDYLMQVEEGSTLNDTMEMNDAISSLETPMHHESDESIMRVQQTPPTISDKDEATHTFDDLTDALVPVAFLRHKEALLEALRACKNITQMAIYNRALDAKHLNAYKRVTEDGEDADEDHEQHPDDNAGEDSSDESLEGEEIDEIDGDEHEAESEVEDVDSAIEDHASQDSNTSDHDHKCDQDHRDILFDVSSTYNFLLFLAAEAGLGLKRMMTISEASSHVCAEVQFGLTDCIGLEKFGSALKEVGTLSLKFIPDQHQVEATPEAVGLRLGTQISAGFSNMSVLTVIRIEFQIEHSLSAWSIIAQAPAIPTLEHIFLSPCVMDMSSFTGFIGKHSATLLSVTISQVRLSDGSLENISALYARLSQAPRIEAFRQGYLFLNGVAQVKFPSRLHVPRLGTEDEDGYVPIHITDWVEWEGHETVTEVLDVMARDLHLG